MGGESKKEETQSSTTNPWEPAQPALQGMLGQIQTGLGNTALTGNESGAINSLISNAGQASQFAPQIQNYAKDLFGGGGAMNEAGAVNANYQDYSKRLSPTADGGMMGANSGLKPYLDTIRDDVTNQVNGSFAAAGRDFSGANFGALGRGISAGMAPVVAAQYNTDVNNQRGAADALYGAGNTNAGILSSMNQQRLGNQGQGVSAAGAANDATNAGNNQVLQAEAARRGIPVQALGLLAQIGIPIAGLGGQSTGKSNTTQQMSGAQQFGLISQGFGNIFGGSGGGAAANAFKMISDRRAKEDIVQVGTLFDGTPVYRYRYIGQPAFQIGLMAQDVEKYAPEAVGMIGQYKAVDYKLATDKAVEAA